MYGQYPINYIEFSNFFGQGYPLVMEILNTDATNLGSTIFVPQQSLGSISVGASYGNLITSSSTGQKEVVINLNYSDLYGNSQCQVQLYLQ
jgi:hypothetical protein